jgi:tryptophanyl-tRNA synthetase
MSLTDPSKKMSKSDANPNSRILITDDVETIHKKFRTALTDSREDITYDPENRPGVSNLLNILKHTTHEKVSNHDLAADFKDSSLRSLKGTVADAVVESLQEVREKFLQLRSSPDKLYDDIRLNQHQARTSASQTMREVRKVLGLAHFG